MQVLRGFNGLAPKPKHSSKPGHAVQSLHALPARPRMRCAAGVAPESSGEVVSGQQVTYSTAPYFSAASAQSVSMDDSGRARTDYGFGFSAGGLLFPYFLGISEQLQSMNVLLPETPVAGASAGSIIAVCAKSGLSEEELLVAFLDLARDCRQGGTRTRLKSVLRRVLEKALPDDIHERCNGRAHLAVTRLWPEFTPQTISSFRSRTDVIDTLLTSSHIPYWFDGSLFTMYRSGVYFDGGITNFIPSTPTDVCYRVSCFPSQQLKAFKGISLSPDTFEQWPHDMGTMLGWAFEPAPEDMLLKLVEKGKRDARSWALANVPVEQLQLAGGGR